jgi:hypothetical protein
MIAVIDLHGFTAAVGVTGQVETYFSRQSYLLCQAVKMDQGKLDRFDFAPTRFQVTRY